MTTRTPVSQGSRLALMAALCCAGLAQAQVAGSSTLLGVGDRGWFAQVPASQRLLKPVRYRAAKRDARPQTEQHRVDRMGWLRAAVLGANDGRGRSPASLMVGVAAGHATADNILLTGVAGLVAGAMSMAAGEYVLGALVRHRKRRRPARGPRAAKKTRLANTRNSPPSTLPAACRSAWRRWWPSS